MVKVETEGNVRNNLIFYYCFSHEDCTQQGETSVGLCEEQACSLP